MEHESNRSLHLGKHARSEGRGTGERRDDAETDAEVRVKRFANALIGTQSAPGILRASTRKGRPNRPYPHQRSTVKSMMSDEKSRCVMVHDPGTGKTFTSLLLVATKYVIRHGTRQKVLVPVPTSCLEQWYQSTLDTLRVSPKRILCTNQMALITTETIANSDIIIVSREIVGRAFSSCHEWVEAHHRTERGHWVSQWDRIAGVTMHPLLEARFSIVFIDELVCCT